MRFGKTGWALRLDCPRCGKTCESFKPYRANAEYPYPHWMDGDTGSCECGARLIVRADGERAHFDDITPETEEYDAAAVAAAVDAPAPAATEDAMKQNQRPFPEDLPDDKIPYYISAVWAVVQWLSRIGGACTHPHGIRTVSGGNVCTRCGIDTRAAAKATVM